MSLLLNLTHTGSQQPGSPFRTKPIHYLTKVTTISTCLYGNGREGWKRELLFMMTVILTRIYRLTVKEE
jgi:hypothetical protein